jgi:hypothetical protein
MILAGMAKLADAPDLGSGAARRVGSSPIARTGLPDGGLFLSTASQAYFQLIKKLAQTIALDLRTIVCPKDLFSLNI